MFTKLTVAAVLAASVVAKTCNRQYTIKEGDICDSIGAANNVSTYQLMSINYPTVNTECTNLQPGSTLCLGYSGEDCSTTYVVQPEDTCEQIASNHGLNTTILSHNNPQIDSSCSNIYVGEVLCVANQVQVPPAGAPVNTAIPTTATAAAHATKSASKSSSGHIAVATGGSYNGGSSNGGSSNDGGDDDDDENLPWCDEL